MNAGLQNGDKGHIILHQVSKEPLWDPKPKPISKNHKSNHGRDPFLLTSRLCKTFYPEGFFYFPEAAGILLFLASPGFEKTAYNIISRIDVAAAIQPSGNLSAL